MHAYCTGISKISPPASDLEAAACTEAAAISSIFVACMSGSKPRCDSSTQLQWTLKHPRFGLGCQVKGPIPHCAQRSYIRSSASLRGLRMSQLYKSNTGSINAATCPACQGRPALSDCPPAVAAAAAAAAAVPPLLVALLSGVHHLVQKPHPSHTARCCCCHYRCCCCLECRSMSCLLGGGGT
jgi:hypothetical protein